QAAPRLNVVEALHQGEEGGFATAGRTDETNPLARADAKVETCENGRTVRVREGYVLQRNAGGSARKRRRARSVGHLMGNEQRRERFRKARHVLRHVDQGDG